MNNSFLKRAKVLLGVILVCLAAILVNFNHTTVHKLAKKGDVEALQKFLGNTSTVTIEEKINERDIFGWSPLHRAAEQGHHEMPYTTEPLCCYSSPGWK